MNKTSLLFYGKSGVGKSSQARYIAEYVHQRYGKKTRVIALDAGSLFGPVTSLIDKGIVEPLLVPTAPEFNPMATMRKVRRGEWIDGGQIVQSKKLGNGQWQNPNQWRAWSEKDSAEIGAYFIDSLTEYANALMYDSKAKNIRIGNEGSQPRVEDGEQIGTNTISHYSDAQGEIISAMTAFLALPIPIVAFTALEDTGTDDDSGVAMTVLGPKIVGKKAITIIPAKVMNNFHLTAEGVGRAKVVKAWYDPHPSVELKGKDWPSKIGLEPQELPEFWKKFPDGHIKLSLDKGIGEYLEWVDSVRGKENVNGKVK